MADDKLNKVETSKLLPLTVNFWHTSVSEVWYEPFNQATFLNHDTVNILYINYYPLSPAQVIGGNIYPTEMTINLNVGEVNRSKFNLDTKSSSTASCHIIYSQYVGVEIQDPL